MQTLDNHVRALLYFQRENPRKTRSLRWYPTAFVSSVGLFEQEEHVLTPQGYPCITFYRIFCLSL